MGGANSLEGRVEICQSNVYSTVCDDFWDELEARVVCAQLGYTGDGENETFNYLMITLSSSRYCMAIFCKILSTVISTICDLFICLYMNQ